MIELDEILYNALKADAELVTAVGDRITSTCFEVSPEEQDNTQLPCIIVTDDRMQNQTESKDSEWETNEDSVQASVEIDGRSPKEVKQLRRMCRTAIANYIGQMVEEGEEIPELESLQSNGIAWDWMKPCYHSTLTYNCIVYNDEQD